MSLCFVLDETFLVHCTDYLDIFTTNEIDYADIFATTLENDATASRPTSSRDDVTFEETTAKWDDDEEVKSKYFMLKQINFLSNQICELNEKCVPYYLCPANKTIVTDGALLIDERRDEEAKEELNVCPSLHTCCTKVNHQKSVAAFGEINEICQERAKFPNPTECGYRNPKGLGGEVKSMSGTDSYAQYAEFPWMTAVLTEGHIDGSAVLTYKCGGSLIHPNVVLTASHNVAGINPKSILVRAGEWDTQSKSEICPDENRKVKQVIMHEDFSRANLQNDIALLILESEFKITPFINIICLPSENIIFDGQRCLTMGWGKNKFGKDGVYQAFLKKIDLPIVEHFDCQTKLRKTRLGEDFLLHDSFICAGNFVENFVELSN